MCSVCFTFLYAEYSGDLTFITSNPYEVVVGLVADGAYASTISYVKLNSLIF